MFSDKISCDAMANPGEEMVCGQCGQTILGKAMKVVIYSIYVLCFILCIIYSICIPIVLFALTFIHNLLLFTLYQSSSLDIVTVSLFVHKIV